MNQENISASNLPTYNMPTIAFSGLYICDRGIYFDIVMKVIIGQ